MLTKLIADISNPAINETLGKFGWLDSITNTQLFLTNFITLGLGIAGIVCFFILLWGGIEYITAGGDKERTQSASKRLTAALIGLTIVFSIFVIIYLVEMVFGVSITKFALPIIE